MDALGVTVIPNATFHLCYNAYPPIAKAEAPIPLETPSQCTCTHNVSDRLHAVFRRPLELEPEVLRITFPSWLSAF